MKPAPSEVELTSHQQRDRGADANGTLSGTLPFTFLAFRKGERLGFGDTTPDGWLEVYLAWFLKKTLPVHAGCKVLPHEAGWPFSQSQAMRDSSRALRVCTLEQTGWWLHGGHLGQLRIPSDRSLLAVDGTCVCQTLRSPGRPRAGISLPLHLLQAAGGIQATALTLTGLTCDPGNELGSPWGSVLSPTTQTFPLPLH